MKGGGSTSEREAVSRRSGGGGETAPAELETLEDADAGDAAGDPPERGDEIVLLVRGVRAGCRRGARLRGTANLAMSSPDIAACVGELCERAAETAQGAL